MADQSERLIAVVLTAEQWDGILNCLSMVTYGDSGWESDAAEWIGEIMPQFQHQQSEQENVPSRPENPNPST